MKPLQFFNKKKSCKGFCLLYRFLVPLCRIFYKIQHRVMDQIIINFSQFFWFISDIMSYGVFDRISQPEGIKSCKTLFGQNLQTGRSFQRIFVEQEKDQFINKLEHLLFKRIWTFDQVQLFIKCPVFRKTGTEKQKNIIFQLIFNEYVNFFPDLFLENRVSKSLVSSFLSSICHPIPFRKSALQIIP